MAGLAAAVRAEDLAAVIYTSGTTGRPKGVELPHDCWVFEAASIETSQTIGPRDVQFLWLPLAHVFGKVCVTLGIGFGFPTAVDGRPDRIAANLAAVKPTFVCVVPRIFERVHAKILEQANAAGPAKAAIFRWALGVGIDVARRRADGRRVGFLLRTRRRVADALVLRRVRARFGGARLGAASAATVQGRAKLWQAGAIPTTSMRSVPHGWQTAGS